MPLTVELLKRTLVIFMFVLFGAGSADADIIFSYEVTDAGHILNGATIAATATGDFTWESPAGLPAADQYAAVNAPWTTTISGATGTGASWNGTYTYSPVFPNVGIAWVSGGAIVGPTSISATGSTIDSRWTDGSNTFAFQLSNPGAGALPAALAQYRWTPVFG